MEYEGQLTIDTSELEDADAGTWLLSFEAEGRRYAERSFSVRRASTLSFDAGPEPVRRKVTFAGKLRRASWERSRFEGVKGERVRVLRLGPVETPNPKRVALLTTKKKGRYSNKQPFPGTDRYQATYAGTAAVAAVSSRVDAVARAEADDPRGDRAGLAVLDHVAGAGVEGDLALATAGGPHLGVPDDPAAVGVELELADRAAGHGARQGVHRRGVVDLAPGDRGPGSPAGRRRPGGRARTSGPRWRRRR